MEEQLKNSVWFWSLLAVMLITQSTWLFIDARKRGSSYWFWGLWGLIQCPLPSITYWLFVRRGLWRQLKQKLNEKKEET
ncbi:sigmaY antisigma factor component [Paenibacillus sp. strain BS8-2]